MPLSILVVGAENPRIGDLFREVGRYAKYSFINVGPSPAQRLALAGANADQLRENIFSRLGKPDVVVFTWPHLAHFAEKFPNVTRVYYCKDPFEHWNCWNPQQIHELESRLLNMCDAVFAVSRSLAEDFRPRTNGKVFYLPNGVEESFLSAAPLPRPANLPVGKPILGCVGQINSTYDWQFITELAANLPEVRICLIGNISESDPEWVNRIGHHLATISNLLFIDRQPHEQIPAFIQHFDILMCLLKPGDFADRRSPLRLYDYLTTEKPVISTAIREAAEHLPHIHIAKTAGEAALLARQMLAAQIPIDLAARKLYIANQTWAHRARHFLIELLELPKLRNSIDELNSPTAKS